MNQLKGQIKTIENHKGLSYIDVSVADIDVKVLILDHKNSDTYTINACVNILFKETEFILSTIDTQQVSVLNQFKGKIIKINKGKLLSEVSLNCCGSLLHSIIPTLSLEKLNLQVDHNIYGLVKSNDIIISPC